MENGLRFRPDSFAAFENSQFSIRHSRLPEDSYHRGLGTGARLRVQRPGRQIQPTKSGGTGERNDLGVPKATDTQTGRFG